jgi:hypothetical protein
LIYDKITNREDGPGQDLMVKEDGGFGINLNNPKDREDRLVLLPNFLNE